MQGCGSRLTVLASSPASAGGPRSGASCRASVADVSSGAADAVASVSAVATGSATTAVQPQLGQRRPGQAAVGHVDEPDGAQAGLGSFRDAVGHGRQRLQRLLPFGLGRHQLPQRQRAGFGDARGQGEGQGQRKGSAQGGRGQRTARSRSAQGAMMHRSGGLVLDAWVGTKEHLPGGNRLEKRAVRHHTRASIQPVGTNDRGESKVCPA